MAANFSAHLYGSPLSSPPYQSQQQPRTYGVGPCGVPYNNPSPLQPFGAYGCLPQGQNPTGQHRSSGVYGGTTCVAQQQIPPHTGHYFPPQMFSTQGRFTMPTNTRQQDCFSAGIQSRPTDHGGHLLSACNQATIPPLSQGFIPQLAPALSGGCEALDPRIQQTGWVQTEPNMNQSREVELFLQQPVTRPIQPSPEEGKNSKVSSHDQQRIEQKCVNGRVGDQKHLHAEGCLHRGGHTLNPCLHHSRRRAQYEFEGGPKTNRSELQRGEKQQRKRQCTSIWKLANYEPSLLDEVLNATAHEIGLSQTEHAALKMDLFRNYIRTYESLRDSIDHQQLERVVHPILAEFVAKNVMDIETTIAAEQQHDAPSSISNVKGFRHGAIFVHHIIYTGGGRTQIIGTYAFDIAKKSKLILLAKKLSPLIRLSASRMQFLYNDQPLTFSLMPLDELGISDGSTLEVFDNKQAKISNYHRKTETSPVSDRPLELQKLSTRGIMSGDDDMFSSFIPRHSHQLCKQKKHRCKQREVYISDDEKSDTSGFDSEDDCEMVPSMAAMEQLAKAYDYECRAEGVHPCQCECGICGSGGFL